MPSNEILAKSILTKRKIIDSWFLSALSMNLYRGCAHACAYCDGRSEGYHVEGDFEKDIAVKINAEEVLRRELDPKRKRKPLPNGFVMLGGGVSDSWQPEEARTKIARSALALLLEYNLPVHVLTKSDLVLRDLDLLSQINQRRRAVVSMSFSTVDDELARKLEPAAAAPTRRLAVLKRLKAEKIFCGAFLMPVIPGMTDTEEQMTSSVKAFADAGCDFVIFGGLTLKQGRQLQHFVRTVLYQHPELMDGYRKIFPGNPYGQAAGRYYDKIHRRFFPIAKQMKLPVRMPDTIFRDLVSPEERVVLLLEHMDYLCRAENRASRFGQAAYLLRKSASSFLEGISRPDLSRMDKEAAAAVDEIIKTGSSSLYRNMLNYHSP